MAQWHNQSLWVTEPAGGGSAPTAPTLAVADQADGTGATATISGADAGTTNTVYTQAVNGELGTATWTNSGSRSGNGTVDLALATGYYWAYISSSDGTSQTPSSNVYFVVTSGTAAVLYRIMTGVQSRIQGLTLSGVANASVAIHKLEIGRALQVSEGLTMPAILITPTRPRFNAFDGPLGMDDVGYGVQVTAVCSDDQEPTLNSNLARQTLWCEKIAAAFRNQRLPGVTDVITTTVEPADIVMPAPWHVGRLASSMVLRFTARETRGV